MVSASDSVVSTSRFNRFVKRSNFRRSIPNKCTDLSTKCESELWSDKWSYSNDKMNQLAIFSQIVIFRIAIDKLINRIATPPIKRSNFLGRRTCDAPNQTNFPFNRTAEQRKVRNEIQRDLLSQTRSTRTRTEWENANEEHMNHRSVETNRATMNLDNLARSSKTNKCCVGKKNRLNGSAFLPI